MATPTLSNVPTTISSAESVTNWSAVSVILDPDIKREGNNSVTDGLRNNGQEFVYTGAPFPTTLTNETIRLWSTTTLTPYMRSFANEGFSMAIGTGNTATAYFTFAGFDTYVGGWLNMAVSVSTSVTPTSGTWNTASTVRQAGIRFLRTTQPRNIDNTWLDYLRYGDGYTAEGGTSGDPITPNEIAAVDFSNGYGIFENTDGVIFGAGTLDIGNATATDFDSVGDLIVFLENQYVRSGLYRIAATGFGTNVLFDGSVIKSAGTIANNRFDFVMDASMTCEVNGCLFDFANSINFNGSIAHTVTNNTFNNVNLITHGGGTFTGNSITNPSGARAVLTTTANMANLTSNLFESDGSSHALEISGTANFTFNNTLSGYVAGTTGSPVSTTSTGNEAIHITATSGTITINVADGASVPSIRSNGATVNVVAGQRTFTVDVSDINTGSPVQNARVYVTAAAGGGLTEGTVIIDKLLTNSFGEVSDTRSYSVDQPYVGVVRRATSGTLYKATSVSGVISSSANTTLNVSLIPDE